MNDTSLHNRPRPWRLQFSLRHLLLTFTAFAIGFPLWYRWPYQEIKTNPAGTRKQITTWQRQWGGGSKKHGLQRWILHGKTFESITYRNDERQGPYESTYTSGQLSKAYRNDRRQGPYESTYIRGQFENDMKEGVWTAPDRTMTWHRDKLHGPSEVRLPPESPGPSSPNSAREKSTSTKSQLIKLTFDNGRLTHCRGPAAAERFFDLLKTDFLDDRTRFELSQPAVVDIVDVPLKDTMSYLWGQHQIPFLLDPKLGPKIDLPLTAEHSGGDLCSALLLLTAPHNLGCDYRYGCIWVTTADDCGNWHDPTGVSEIKPPSNSLLAKVWNENVVLDAVEMPLKDAMNYFEGLLAIHIDTTRIKAAALHQMPVVRPTPTALPVRAPLPTALPKNPPLVDPFSVTVSLRDIPFRHVLGQMLYKNNCRCQLDGDKLILLPPDENEAKPEP